MTSTELNPQGKGAIIIKARCLAGHLEVLNSQQLADANTLGCPMCSQCGQPMVVVSTLIRNPIGKPKQWPPKKRIRKFNKGFIGLGGGK